MKTEIRSCIALICAFKLNKKYYKGIYDYTEKKINLYNIVKSSENMINVYDYNRKSYIEGDFNTLYDSKENKYIILEFDNYDFKGYDYESKSFFLGFVSDKSVSIYDRQYSNSFLYILPD